MDTIKRVQDLMQVRDMNLCVLAKKCGISYSTIQTTARRGGQLSVETIERICQGLGITLKDFFDSSYLPTIVCSLSMPCAENGKLLF